ncbi:MAG: amino acid ABC transporter ATP-binding protein [Alphaproteobacteria bacterium]|jgi:ABC-type polar amino acid transport system ATPase subunit|nr:amino acid ABC transporter ATP-binding protein [Alphaproteobacteria bacterium]
MLKASHLSKSFHNQLILNDISFDIPMGTIAALLGPSGSGKSTLLRCISRLENAESGNLTFQEQSLSDLPPWSIGMVFQGFHLFPHMTILQNLIHAPVQLKQLSKDAAMKQGKALLKQFGLSDKAEMHPNQLSGGQKQRVAIARALIVNPPILLFDEPTSALDPEMVSEVASLIKSLKSPERLIIMATHELRVAKLAADQILFLDQGILVEDDPKDDFFKKPKTKRATQFIKNLTVS